MAGVSTESLLIRLSAGCDDVGAAAHIGLRLVEVAGIEGRENLVAIAVGTQAPSMYFLSPDAMLSAWHRADILSNIFMEFGCGGGHGVAPLPSRRSQFSHRVTTTGDGGAASLCSSSVPAARQASLNYDRFGRFPVQKRDCVSPRGLHPLWVKS